jgi:hypothetical protein
MGKESAGSPADPDDAWSLFEPRYRAKLERFKILAYFILSSSTSKVAYVRGKKARQVDAIGVYGPRIA